MTTEKPTKSSHSDLQENFKCILCNLDEQFDYKGRKPPFAKQIEFIEDCYVMKDPFSAPKRGQYLILGADCSLCNKPVCKGTNCSLFYCKTFCLKCIEKNLNEFPSEVQVKVSKLLNM